MFPRAVNSKRRVQLFHRTVSTCTSPDPQSSRSSLNFDLPLRSRTTPPVVVVGDKEPSYSQVHDASCSSSLVDNTRSTPEFQAAHATGKGKPIHDYHKFVRPEDLTCNLFDFAEDVDRMGRYRTADFNLFMDVRSLIDTPLSEIQRRDGMAAPNSYVFILEASTG